MLRENAFLSRNENGVYHFHNLFKSFLAKHCPNDELQKAVCRRAGLWYIRRQDYSETFSATLFQKADCIEEFLSILNQPGARHLDYYDMDAIVALTDTLHDDICLSYPFPFLQILFYMLLSGNRSYGVRSKKMFNSMWEYFSTLNTSYGRRILGELIVITRVTGFGQLETGNESLEKAAALLDGHPSEMIKSSDPFTFGLPMLLYSEFLKPGTLDESVTRCQYNPYELVTDGFGHGSERLIQAEAALLRCQMNEAKIYASQSIASAEEKRQYCVMASGYFVLMRRALFLGDTEQAAVELNSIRNLLTEVIALPGETRRTPANMMRQTIMLAECFFAATLRKMENVPPEFFSGRISALMVAGMGIPQIYAACIMLRTGDDVGAERMCLELSGLTTVCQCAKLYSLIIIAMAREKLYGAGKGLENLKTAVDQARKDNILLPFAENPELLPMLAKLPQDIFTKTVIEKCRSAKKAAPSLSAQSMKRLSERELEVLRLMAAGKSRAEAAYVLGVQENTVKMHLSSIYRKLNASGKTDAIRIARTNSII